MSKLTDEEIKKIASTPAAVVGSYVHTFARAIESAATEPLLQRIAELERQLEEARNQVLEEAARCCDAEEKRGQHNMTCDIPKNHEFWNGGAMFAGQLAEEIRALKGAKE